MNLMQQLAQAERAVLARRMSSLRSASQMPDMLIDPTATLATHFSSVAWGTNSTLTTVPTVGAATARDARVNTCPQPGTAMSAVRPILPFPANDVLANLIRSMSVKMLPLGQPETAMAPPTPHMPIPLAPTTPRTNPLAMRPSLDEVQDEYDTTKRNVAAAYAMLANAKAGEYVATMGMEDDSFAQDQAMHPSPFTFQPADRSDSDGLLPSDTDQALPAAAEMSEAIVSGRNSTASVPDWQMGSMSLLELHAGMDVDGLPEEPFTPTAATAAAAMAGASQLLHMYEQQVLAKAAGAM